MDNKKENNNHYVSFKKILLIFGVTIIIILALAILFYININKDTSKTIKGSIKYKGDDYIILDAKNSEKDYLIDIEDDNVKEECEVGDEISLTIDKIKSDKDPIEAEAKNVKIIKKVEKEDELIIEEKSSKELEEKTTSSSDTSNNSASTNSNDNSSNNKQASNNSTTNYKQSNNIIEEDPVTYFNSVDKEVDKSISRNSLSESAKAGFVNIVDFLFYNKAIKGKTFEDLSTSVKLKLLKLGMAIDKKIESKFPEYKETLANKYQNVKSKAISKYLDKTTEVCSKNEDVCAEAKKGLTDLKNNFSITWSFIKDISGVGISKLKSWYEIWRET